MNCPKCGAEKSGEGAAISFSCRSMSQKDGSGFFQSDLCAEREAHNETRRKLESAEIQLSMWHDGEIISEAHNETRRKLDVCRERLGHILEYWNRDQNEAAMTDALWHIIETAADALEETK